MALAWGLGTGCSAPRAHRRHGGAARGAASGAARRITCRAAGEESPAADAGRVQMVYSKQDFDAILSSADAGPVVLDISTTTCGPCKLIFPYFAELSNEYPDAVFAKINGDHDADTRALMKEWGVKVVPTFHFIRGGEVEKVHTGGNPDKLKEACTEFLS